MAGHLALVFYIQLADYIQPYLLERVYEYPDDKHSYLIETWRIQTPNCYKDFCPTEFPYFERGYLPKSLFENVKLFNKIEAYLELFHQSPVIFGEGKLNRYGFFNITSLKNSNRITNLEVDKIDELEFASCYTSSPFVEDKEEGVFEYDWNLTKTLVISKSRNISIVGELFNLENQQAIFKEWFHSFTKSYFNDNLIQPINIRKQIKMIWESRIGNIVRLSHFYTKNGLKMNDEL